MRPASLVAAVALMGAAVLVASRPTRRPLRRLGGAGGPRWTAERGARSGRRRFRWPALLVRYRAGRLSPWSWGCPVASLAAVAGLWVAGPVAAVVSAVYAMMGVRAVLGRAAVRADRGARVAAAEALAGLADDLRAGRAPTAALRVALESLAVASPSDELRDAAAAVESGGDVVRALRAVRGPSGPSLQRLAAAWALTDAGIPLADVLDRLEEELRAVARAEEQAGARTASARTTARLVAALPLAGLLIGYGLGADPVRVLTRTPVGTACALGGVALHLAGFAWAGRIARMVGR